MDAEIPETISALKDLTLNNLLPKEIVLAVKSANSLNSHTTLSHVINQTEFSLRRVPYELLVAKCVVQIQHGEDPRGLEGLHHNTGYLVR